MVQSSAYYEDDDEEYVENQSNTQKTVYVKYPNSNKNKACFAEKNTIIGQQVRALLSSKAPFIQLKGIGESAECATQRAVLFQKYWANCETRINSVLHDHHMPLLSKIIQQINSPVIVSQAVNIGVNTWAHVDTSFENKLQTTLLLSGTNIADHIGFFTEFSQHVQNHHKKYVKLVSLDSKSCSDIKTTLKLIILQLYDDARDLSSTELDFDAVKKYCLDFYEKEARERKIKLVDVSSTKLRIVFMVKNLNTFSQLILLKILTVVQKNIDIIPFKLILNAASFSVESSESALPSGLRRALSCSVIENFHDSGSVIDKVAEQAIFSMDLMGNRPILLGPKLISAILIRHRDSTATTKSFVNCMKYALMLHFYSMPLAVFTDLHIEDSDIFEVHGSSASSASGYDAKYVKYIRHLPSFQKFVVLLLENAKTFESTAFKNLMNELVNKENNVEFFIEKLVPFAISNFAKNTRKFFRFLEFLNIIQTFIHANKLFCQRKSISNEVLSSFEKHSKTELYSVIINRDPVYSKFVKRMLNAVSAMAPNFVIQMVDKLQSFVNNFGDENPLLDQFFKSIGSVVNDLNCNFKQTDSQFYVDIWKDEKSNNDGLKYLPLQGKIQFEKIVETLKNNLMEHFFKEDLLSFSKLDTDVLPHSFIEDSSQSDLEKLQGLMDINIRFHKLQECLLSELFIVNTGILPSVMFPPVRKNIEYALSNPKEYLLAHNVKLDITMDYEYFENGAEKQLNNKTSDASNSSKKKRKMSGSSGSTKKNKTVDKSSEDSDDLLNGLYEETDLINQILLSLRNLNDPLICEMFRLYREAPVNINIYDYFQSFQSSLSKKHYLQLFSSAVQNAQADMLIKNSAVLDNIYKHLLPYESLKQCSPKTEEFKTLRKEVNEEWNLIALSFFLEYLADLQYMGIIKEGKRKIETMQKAVWKSL